MAGCAKCGKSLGIFERANGFCSTCWKGVTATTSADDVPEQTPAQRSMTQHPSTPKLILTTEAVSCEHVTERLGIVSGSCIYGQHLGKDILALWRDALGGRGKAIEKVFSDARAAALDDLRLEAHSLGATSVVAIQISHQEITGGGKSMIMVTATGTAVR